MDNSIMLELMAKVREEAERIKIEVIDDSIVIDALIRAIGNAALKARERSTETYIIRAIAWGVLTYEKMKKEQK